MIHFDWNACRRGTQEMLLTGATMFTSGQRQMSVNMPTRYGKTPTGRLFSAISTRGWRSPLGIDIAPFASVNVWATVNLILREQAASAKHWKKTQEIFHMSEQLRYGEITDSYDNWHHLRPNGEEYLAINIHKIVDYIDMFSEWTDHLIKTTHLPPIFHFDEAQFYSGSKPWGSAVYQLLDAGAGVITHTATPSRSDKGLIPCFIAEKIGDDEFEQKVLRDTFEKDGERWGIFDRNWVKLTDYRMRAHVDVPFSEAWAKGYLLKASYRTVDLRVSEINSGGSEEIRNLMLSQVSPSIVRQNGLIGDGTRSHKAISESVGISYEQMMQYRRINPRSAIAGFTVSDQDGGRNEHAGHVKEEFLRVDPSLKIAIATQKVDGSHDLIRSFDESDFDVILFKGMGGVGWDCPRVQVILDLGQDRQDASSIQKWTRGGTPDGMNKVFTIVTLADKLNQGIWNRCIENEGGSATEKVSELVDQELQKIKEKDRSIWILKGAETGDFRDNDGIEAEAADAPLASALFALASEFRLATDAGIVHKARNLGIQVASTGKGKSIDQEINGYQKDIVVYMSEATSKLYAYLYGVYDQSKTAQKNYAEASTELYRVLYNRAGLSYDRDWVPVSKNRNLDQLQKLDEQAQILREEMRRNAGIPS